MKYYDKFYEVGCNAYYILNVDNVLYLATEIFSEKKRLLFNKFLKPKRLTQGLSLLELSPIIMKLLFNVSNAELENENKDFIDMNIYKKVDNKELIKEIKESYQYALDEIIKEEEDKFNNFCTKLRRDMEDRKGNIDEDDFEKRITVHRDRFNLHINKIKSDSPLNYISLNKGDVENVIIKKMLTGQFEYLYSLSVDTNTKYTYIYEMDKYGTITIYKFTLVRDNVKKVETFLYNVPMCKELIDYSAKYSK